MEGYRIEAPMKRLCYEYFDGLPRISDTFWSFKHALRYIRKKVSSQPLGIWTVAAMLPKEWNKRLVDLNSQELMQKDLDWADICQLSAMSIQTKIMQ